MKKTFLILLISLLINSLFAQANKQLTAENIIDTLKTESKITDVTVFLSGAVVTREIDLKANKGKFLLMINNLPQELNSQSIQVNVIEKTKILSVKHQLVFPTINKKEKSELEAENNIDLQKFKISEIRNKYKVFELEEELILKNSVFEKPEIKEIKEAADFYRSRLNEIKQEKLILAKELEDANKKLQELYVRLNEITGKNRKTYSQILIILDCEQQINGKLKISYYVPSAGWVPIYDFRVNDITEPLSIVYNSNVFQSTGENWDNVKLTLSTNNPSLSGHKPEILAWYLNRRSPYQKTIQQGSGTLSGRVLDIDGAEISFANIILRQNGHIITGGTSDADGSFTIKPISIGYYDVEVSNIGYKTMNLKGINIQNGKITYQTYTLEDDISLLNTVQILEYKNPLISADKTSQRATINSKDLQKMPGRDASSVATNVAGVYSEDGSIGSIRSARAGAKVDYVDETKPTSKITTTNNVSYSLKTNMSNLEYAIEIPYTIPSDGKDYFVKIKEVSLPVTYIYNTVPKLDNGVFLTALITDWTELNLLSGKSNIYYQGTYTGESFINAESTEDTLNVSLGRDRSIIVQREYNKKVVDKKIIGNSIKETIAWDITVRNNKNSKIKIIVEDQFPLSEVKTIEIERLGYSNAILNEKTGKLTWEFELAPTEKTVLNYKYSVKYPNNVNLSLD